jgi:hypothetical protein
MFRHAVCRLLNSPRVLSQESQTSDGWDRLLLRLLA